MNLISLIVNLNHLFILLIDFNFRGKSTELNYQKFVKNIIA